MSGGGESHAPPAWHEDALTPPTACRDALPAATIKLEAEHFSVTELPAAAPSGDGPHLWLEIERRGMNTEYAARVLARAAGASPRDVGFAGLKDRHALTRQWFSVPFAGDADALARTLDTQGLRVTASARNARKLRRGALAGNRFRLLVLADGPDPGTLAHALERVRRDGVPNYFGAQRFGHGGGNLERAHEMLCRGVRVRDRHRRGLYLSAARSALFNRVLAARVAAGTWGMLLAGEAVALDGSASFFVADSVDATLERRLHAFDVHPSGPLCGRDPSPARGEAAAVEADALRGCEEPMRGLAAAGLDHARRALRVAVCELAVTAVAGAGWRLEFSLPAGAYATVVLRELFRIRDAASPP